MLLLALTLSAPAGAEEPLWGEVASTLGKGFLDVTTRGLLQEFKPYRHHGGPVFLSIERMEIGATVEYGLRSDLDLDVRVPFFTETIEERSLDGTVRHPLSGIGEARVGTRWRFRQSITGRHKDELALLAEVKLPTGGHELRDRNGAVIAPHLQPNSGNPGVFLGLAANRHTAWGGAWLSATFSAETASPRYHRGGQIELHASAGRRARRLTRPEQTDWMGIVGLHYHGMEKDTEFGRTIRDSGGSILSGEMSLIATRRARSARLGILFPLRTDLGRAHPPPRYELQASIRASF
jgi:hypothetical protein